MNGTLWNPAAPPLPGLRAAALVMLCLWAGPALAETAPSGDAAGGPTSTPPTSSTQVASAPAAQEGVRTLEATSRSDMPPSAPSVARAGASEAPPGLITEEVAGATAADVAAAEAPGAVNAAPVDDARPVADMAKADPVEVPEWRPEGMEEEEDVGASAGAMLLRTVLVLGVVLAAIYLTLNVGLRRLMGLSAVGGRGNNALLQVVERHPVGPRHALLVIRAGEDHLVVSQSEGQMNLISRIDPAQVEAHAAARAQAAPAVAPALSPFLQKLLARRGEPVQSPEPAPPPPSTPPSV
ncbi:MAG TPA: flagellar biosynthetic protein FliO [Myxococcaceae bacterium]|nr:flagellar biosynthetic protein FliO [Myxococcaceae bacterium]